LSTKVLFVQNHQEFKMIRIDLSTIIDEESQKLAMISDHTDAANVLYNLISLKNANGNGSDNYRDIKKFLENYVLSLKDANYGYDNINYAKIDSLFLKLTINERISIIQFAISNLTRELPELDVEWFIDRRHEFEVQRIFQESDYLNYPKAFLLYCGRTIPRLISTLFGFVFLVSLILLPAPFPWMSIYKIQYVQHSEPFYSNHLLNVMCLFLDMDNGPTISATCWWGLILLMIAKCFFVILIVNFIYIRLSDKITVK
jgi:hypothetical protein